MVLNIEEEAIDEKSYKLWEMENSTRRSGGEKVCVGVEKKQSGDLYNENSQGDKD